MDYDSDSPARDLVLVRNLRKDDAEALIAIDAASVGRRRDQFLARSRSRPTRASCRQAETDDHVGISPRAYYGEFGGGASRDADVLGVHRTTTAAGGSRRP
jgi:hypothetical protein